MGTIVAGTIIDRARRTLLELLVGQTSNADTRWDRTRELLPLLNAGQRAICVHKPSAYTKNASMVLVTGIKQTIPSDGTELANVEHNLGSGGTTVGRAIVLIDRLALSRLDPDWTTATGSAIEHYVHDVRDPKTFYVYPRPSGTWYVNLSYFAIPPDISSGAIDSGAISIDDIYDTALHDFIVGYAILKNSKRGDTGKASYFLQRFAETMGIQLERATAFAPLDQPAATKAPDALGKP